LFKGLYWKSFVNSDYADLFKVKILSKKKVKSEVEEAKSAAYGLSTENKYQAGDLMSERSFPFRKLKIISYSHRVYTCENLSSGENETISFSERDIMPKK
jgi:hypothetical protein